jgi:chorismate mutase/prephenate dehydratase
MKKIAVLGPKGTFTDEAAESYFGKGKVGYAPSISDVFEEIKSGKADYGVVPIENSTEGSVSETIECLKKYDLKINAEIYYKIEHVLAGVGELKDVKNIRSHPQAIKQCMNKLSKATGKIPKIITKIRGGDDYSTAGAMASVAKAKDPTIAAIGSKKAAKRYGLNILVDNLADREDNETRFFVIAKKEGKKSGKDKTSLVLAVKDEAGALYNLLGVFSKSNINLTKIESRPSKSKKWEYIFLIDFEGHENDKEISKVLDAIKDNTTYYKLLGSYPRG